MDGRRVPVVGAVSMDNITVDLGPEPRGGARRAGGADRRRACAPRSWPQRLDTINYEITCGISRRVPREYHRDGEPA